MTRLQLFLLAGMGLVAALHFLGRPDPARRNFVYAPDMEESPAYASQSENPNFADGKTLQRLPAGTIARGWMPLHTAGLLLDVQRPYKQLSPAQKEAWNQFRPPAGGKQDLARGEAVFVSICGTCHGLGGLGDGLVTKRGVPPPPSLLAANARALSDGRIFRMITAGEGNMPSHAAQVTRPDRWKVIRYIRTLQEREPAK